MYPLLPPASGAVPPFCQTLPLLQTPLTVLVQVKVGVNRIPFWAKYSPVPSVIKCQFPRPLVVVNALVTRLKLLVFSSVVVNVAISSVYDLLLT